VLRPFRDDVAIFVAPTYVLLVRSRGGLKPKPLTERSLRVEPENAGGWTAALAALDVELEQPIWRGANARVVISDHWVRHDVLPWSVELAKDSERLAHARYLLASTYGDVVEQWSVALSDASPRAPRLISAIPAELLSEIKRIAASHDLRLRSIQPNLVVAYNLWRHRLPRAAAWFTTIDEGYLVALHVRDGQCDRVRSVRISDDWTVELGRIQTLGRLGRNRPAEGPVLVDAPQSVRTRATDRDAAVVWLRHGVAKGGTLARLAALRETHA
jgi:hypothetical protein